MKSRKLILSFEIIVVIILLSFMGLYPNPVISEEASQPEQKVEEITAKRVSITKDGLVFCLTVIPGDENLRTFAIVTITNLTNQEVIVPRPLVMPLVGGLGGKNVIQVKNEEGKVLEMTGIHADYIEQPIITLRALSESSSLISNTNSRLFELEENFPGIGEPGKYTIDFRMISQESAYSKSTWYGTVDLSVSIEKGGRDKTETEAVD